VSHKLEGKIFYRKMTKGETEISLGQDVYLENNQDTPYVARLQEIFVYAFAPSEVYFNARWYYRVNDVHEYAKMSGARGDVEYEGRKCTADPSGKELFFSLHMDENHADCILRPCSVYYVKKPEQPTLATWDALTSHEFLAWRAYHDKHVYSLVGLPSKKLRDSAEAEVSRSPQGLLQRVVPSHKMRPSYAKALAGDTPLAHEELNAIWLPRKHLEVFMETEGSTFQRVVTGTLVRVSQLLNGMRTFHAAYVMAVKRMPRPYKLGPRMSDIALQVRTQTGNRLVGVDTLSNEPCSDAELTKFKVPLDPEAVRKKIRSLQRAMQEDAELFEAEELRRRMELEERLREKREEEARAKMMEEEERERKERERDEVRRRAASSKQESEAWWLQYNNKAGDKDREIAKLKARLARFQKIAATSAADGERENATRLAEQAEAKLNILLEGD